MNLRKVLSVLCAVAILTGALPAAFAAGDFQITDGVLEKYTGPGGHVVIPDGVTGLGDFAFYDCKSLTNVTIPSGVTSIGEYAFTNCDNLTGVTVPGSVTSIGSNTFACCGSLTFITVESGNENYMSEDGVLFDKDKTTVILCPAGKAGAYEIPSGVTDIGEDAFDSCGNLTAVTIPDSVTGIGRGAFSGCGNLSVVTIPDSVTSIEDYAFSSCHSLTNVTIPSSVTSIGNKAFAYCDSLNTVTIPPSVTSIAWRAFEDCYAITAIYGAEGSYAQTWAAGEGYTFRAVPTDMAYAATQSVLVDGAGVEFQCYALKDEAGNPTNYVKLRDVAFVLSGTSARFNVDWDGVVNMNMGKAYVPNGSEMSTPFSGDRAYYKATDPISVNGTPLPLDAIVLTDDRGGAYTYFKLRDLGQALGFNVGWSGTDGIFIETGKPYDPNN